MQFSRATFQFLRDLAKRNDKAWFHANRERYEQVVRAPAYAVIRALAAVLSPDYIGEAKAIGGSLSPPNRDLRFARDKSPYRTHIAIRMRHRLALAGAPGPTFLLWIAPGGSFLAAGVHAHNGESLRRIRRAIIDDPARWSQVRDLGALDDEGLARLLPAGVAPDHPFADDLRRRHYTVTRTWTQQEIARADFVDRLIQTAQQMRPFADFMAEALYGVSAFPAAPVPRAG